MASLMLPFIVKLKVPLSQKICQKYEKWTYFYIKTAKTIAKYFKVVILIRTSIFLVT